MPLLRQALAQVVAQARRASDVVTRLRRLVERPDAAMQSSAIDLPQAVIDALHLLEPQLSAHKVQLHPQFAPLACLRPVPMRWRCNKSCTTC